MAKIGARFIKKNDNHLQVGASDSLELKLKTGGGIAADVNGLYVDSTIAGDLIFKGNLDASALGSQLNNAKSGWFWKASVAGTLWGSVELAVGDNLYCTADVTGTPANGTNFAKIDNTEDPNNVRNTGSAVAKAIPRFVDVSGKLIENTSVILEDDGSITIPSGATIKRLGAKMLIMPRSERFVLTATDLTNKYIDMGYPSFNGSFMGIEVIVNGVVQDSVLDFVATNGGAGGNLRIGWTGLGLDGLLASGDIVNVFYFVTM